VTLAPIESSGRRVTALLDETADWRRSSPRKAPPVGAYRSMLLFMGETTRITVTLPTEQVTELRKLTDNVSGYVAEAVARQIRHQLLGEDLRSHQEEQGAFSDEELAEARARIFGTAEAGGPASAA
jgi:hypothetical protein